MCINLNPSICDFLPSRCGVCNSCGCVCFCVTVKRRGGKQGGNKHLEYIQDTVRLTPPTLKYVCYICTDWWFSSEKTEHKCVQHTVVCIDVHVSLLIYLELKKKRLYHWCFQTVYLIWTSDQWMKWCAMVWCAMVWVTEHDILNWSNAAGWSGQNPFLCTVSVSTHTLYID